MISELLRKWFGLSNECASCIVLRDMLEHSERERRELLTRILDGNKVTELPVQGEEPIAITPQHVPWRVKQQMLEAEDRKAAELLRNRKREIEELEKELGVKDAIQERETA